jgi:hypothetical protein
MHLHRRNALRLAIAAGFHCIYADILRVAKERCCWLAQRTSSGRADSGQSSVAAINDPGVLATAMSLRRVRWILESFQLQDRMSKTATR